MSQDRPLKLAFLGDPNSVHTRRWLAAFAEKGHRVTLILRAEQPVSAGFPERVAIERLDPFTGLRYWKQGALRARSSLHRLIARIEPDVLHAHYVTGNAWRAWLSGFHPYVVTVWGSDVLGLPRAHRIDRFYARLSLRSADVVTAGSEELVRAASSAGARSDRIRRIHFGVDTGRFSPGPRSNELHERLDLGDARVVLSNRLIAPLYRQQVVVRSLARLPGDVVVVMTKYGAREDELTAVRRLADELGVSGRLRIVDALPESDLPDLYRLADVVVSVPASDGGPVTLVEALASGRPVVATDVPAVREWLGELDPEALVPVDDVEATTRAIGAVLTRDPAETARKAELARSQVVERADRAVNMDRMDSIYRELAARKAAR